VARFVCVRRFVDGRMRPRKPVTEATRSNPLPKRGEPRGTGGDYHETDLSIIDRAGSGRGGSKGQEKATAKARATWAPRLQSRHHTRTRPFYQEAIGGPMYRPTPRNLAVPKVELSVIMRPPAGGKPCRYAAHAWSCFSTAGRHFHD
jgi:hypothetical protein